MKRKTVFFQLIVVVLIALSYGSSYAGKKTVLVSLFENLSKEKDVVTYEANSNSSSLDFRRKVFSVDRYSEIPRSLLEDRLVGLGVNVVERQSLNKLLLENEFITNSGLADTTTAIEVGKMLGANTLVVGTITDISQERKTFKGYGIRTDSLVVVTNLRVRVIDVEQGEIVYSKNAKGSANIKYGTAKPPIYDSVEDAVKNIVNDEKFVAFFRN